MEETGKQAAENRQKAACDLHNNKFKRNSNKARIGNCRGKNRNETDHEAIEPECLFGEASGDEAAKRGCGEQAAEGEQMQRLSQVGLLIKCRRACPENNKLDQ